MTTSPEGGVQALKQQFFAGVVVSINASHRPDIKSITTTQHQSRTSWHQVKPPPAKKATMVQSAQNAVSLAWSVKRGSKRWSDGLGDLVTAGLRTGMKATILFLHKHASNWQRQCVVGLGWSVDAGTRIEPSEVLKHEEKKHNFMTSGEGCTRPSAQGVARTNFFLVSTSLVQCGRISALSPMSRQRPWMLWNAVIFVTLDTQNQTAHWRRWSRWKLRRHFPARPPTKKLLNDRMKNCFGVQAETFDDGFLPPVHSPMSWGRLQRLWHREEAWLPGLCWFKWNAAIAPAGKQPGEVEGTTTKKEFGLCGGTDGSPKFAETKTESISQDLRCFSSWKSGLNSASWNLTPAELMH